MSDKQNVYSMAPIHLSYPSDKNSARHAATVAVLEIIRARALGGSTTPLSQQFDNLQKYRDQILAAVEGS
ncbi:MAG: hypothetical protein AB8G18_02840 [Gammaproteobacteria bacterium]